MLNDYRITTQSPGETRALGARIGRALENRSCVALIGPLGAGKTQLVKGIAAGAGVDERVMVNSPTFVIVNEYPGRMNLCHVDAYRLTGPEELRAIGFEEMLAADAAVIVEWADRVAAALPPDHLAITLEHAGPDQRRITCVASGPRSRRLLEPLVASA